MKIDIDISDDRHYTDVALVVDRDDFLKEVKRLRLVLGVKRLYSKNDDGSSTEVIKPEEEQLINKEVEICRKKLYLPVVFTKVIEAAVFRGSITNDDYFPAYLVCQWNFFDNEGQTPDETYSIVLSPGVRDTDVIKVYQEYRDQLGNIKGVPDYKYIHRIWNVDENKPSIRKHRKWYWAFKSGKTDEEICTEDTVNCPVKEPHNTGKEKPKNCTCYDESTIRKAITEYEKLIWKTRTL